MGLAEDLIGTQLNDLETLERMESEIVSIELFNCRLISLPVKNMASHYNYHRNLYDR